MRRSHRRRRIARRVDFLPGLEVVEDRVLLSITARGPAVLVNTGDTTGSQNSPGVAMDANGDSIVVWNDASKEVAPTYSSDIHAQRYSPSGAPVNQNGTAAGAQEFAVNAAPNTQFLQHDTPAVAMDANGDFVVAWLLNDVTVLGAYTYEIQARVFNAAGVAQTGDINVTVKDGTVARAMPSVAMDNSGNWVITWADQGTGRDIFAKKYSLGGAAIALNGSTNPLLVNNGTTANNQVFPSVATDATGNFVITWTSLNAAANDGDIFAQRFNSTGVAQGSQIPVNTTTAGNQGDSTVAMTSSGDFIIAWDSISSTASSTNGDIFYKRYNADGSLRNNPTDVDLQANATSVDDQEQPSVDMDANGNATIAWNTVPDPNGGGGNGISIRRINAQGQPIEGADIPVGATGSTSEDEASIGVDGQGDVAVAYHVTASGNEDIFGQFFKYVNDAPTLNQPANPTINENAGQQTVNLAGITAGGPAGASNPESQTLTVTASSNNTTLIPNPITVNYTSPGATGTVSFTPAAGQFGTATITVTLSDNGGTANGGVNQVMRTFTVTVNPVNSAPVVTTNPVSQTVNAGQTVTFTAAASGTPTPTVQWQVSTNGGSTFTDIAGATSTTLSFTAGTSQSGNQYQAVFTNSVGSATTTAATLTVNSVPVVTTSPTSQTVAVGQTATFTAAATGSPAPTVQWQVSTDGGSTFNNIAGATSTTLSFTASLGQSGNQYHAVFTNSVGSAITGTATLTVVAPPTANGQSVSVAHDTAKGITLTGSDPNTPPRSLTYIVVTNPSHGTLSGTAPNLTYTPNPGYQGSDSFTFKDNNGVSDSNVATVTLTVAAAVPTATSQSVSVSHNVAKPITLAGTDGNDSPALPLTFAVATSPAHGTLSGFNPTTGAVTYTPNAGYHGSDSFTFTTSNGQFTSSPATVTLTVAAGVPTANPQTVSTNQNTSVGITLTGSDDDSPALPLTFAVATSPAHGTLSGFNPTTGAVTYTPNAGFSGGDSFQFTVSNGTNTSTAATVTINVASTNVAPVVTTNPVSQTVAVGQTATFTAAATGSPAPTVQWQVSTDGGSTFNNIAGATSTTLSFTASLGQSGNQYRAVFTNSVGSATTTAATLMVEQATIASTVGVAWGTSGTATLQTNADGLRLLPAGRNTDMPWLGINKITITLNAPASLSASDVIVTGVNVANYGPVTISGSGTSYTITLAQPINAADRVTVTIGNANIATFTRRLDVLPGDVNDDDVVNSQDAVIVRNAYLGFGTVTIPLVFLDVNGDGVVDANDYNLVRQRNGTVLP